nr:LysR family transcriptional regulator [Bacillus subtilis]
MTQPPLSQQIKQLEEEVGVTLLKRTKRFVELTAKRRNLFKSLPDGIDANRTRN